MSKVRGALLLLVLLSAGFATGQTVPVVQINSASLHQATVFTAHRSAKPPKPARLRAVYQGPEGEPALPDNAPNPKPVAVADQPTPVALRRRKLRLHLRT